jgi:hypothetical protein
MIVWKNVDKVEWCWYEDEKIVLIEHFFVDDLLDE